jgi:hypothetical protein
MIQVAAVSVLAHHAEHGDVTLVNTLVDAMPKGSRVNALRDYILTFGKVTYNEATKAFDHDKAGNFDQAGAEAIMWTEFKPEQAYVPFDMKALLAAVIKKADTALKDVDHSAEVDTQTLDQLRTLHELAVARDDEAATLAQDAATLAPELEGTF